MSFRKRPLLIVCSEQWKTRPGDVGGHRFVPGTARVATSNYMVSLSCSDCMLSCYQARAEIMFGLSSLWSSNVSSSTTFHTAVIFRTKFVSQYVFAVALLV